MLVLSSFKSWTKRGCVDHLLQVSCSFCSSCSLVKPDPSTSSVTPRWGDAWMWRRRWSRSRYTPAHMHAWTHDISKLVQTHSKTLLLQTHCSDQLPAAVLQPCVRINMAAWKQTSVSTAPSSNQLTPEEKHWHELK